VDRIEERTWLEMITCLLFILLLIESYESDESDSDTNDNSDTDTDDSSDTEEIVQTLLVFAVNEYSQLQEPRLVIPDPIPRVRLTVVLSQNKSSTLISGFAKRSLENS
jgi:hypothetical protein